MFIEAIQNALTVKSLLLVSAGSLLGITIGALPGLTITMTTALLVSLTYGWPTWDALALIMGAYVGSMSGGAISAVLLNIPGMPSACATTFDGYPMAQRGEAGTAIGMARTASLFGSLIGMVFLAGVAPIVANFALKFGPYEYFYLILMGLTMISSLSGGSFIKGMIAGLLGMFLSIVGMDPIWGTARYTFGNFQLMRGLNFVAVLIGLMGMSELLIQASKKHIDMPMVKEIKKEVIKLSELWRMKWLILQSSLIGIWIGALPGIGQTIATLAAYDAAKRTVKNPKIPFGQGAIEGVVAPEVADNACIGGALIPMLALGIPGDSTTAILLGAFMMHGIRPGPLFMSSEPSLFWFIVIMGTIAAIAAYFLVRLGSKVFPKILLVKANLLLPVIGILCVVGSYATEGNVFDIFVMLFFGVLGFLLRLMRFPVSSIVIGFVLGQMADSELRRALMLAQGKFIQQSLTRPISLILIIAIIAQLLLSNKRLRERMKFATASIIGSKKAENIR
ncbi:MAG TPA: tripartite tricarboxylate transporter permease [Bacillota bacterium]|nr:tripartite tricarboxylate transporter permease [Bacillota bacterium]HOA15139.1 tripartite tricarboxylate transporter permease [Bacillota bacterium]HOG52939.1 tripartite tricarboxylate transporter permease [Bacillota bacterium]